MADLNLFENKTVGFIGGGNMAQAIGLRLIEKGILKPNNVWVSSRTEKTLNIWKNIGVNTTFHNFLVVENCNIVFLAVKPQVLDEALKTSRTSEIDRGQLFISIIVGVPLATLTRKLNPIQQNARIIRTMPNTSLMVSKGITVYCSLRATAEDENIVKVLFSELGICEKIPESLMNSAGGLSGSGPAYAYMIIEALADGAVRKGLPRELATRFAAQVLVGAGTMVLETKKHPGQLKDEVCSPGGTSITGIHALEQGSVRASMMNAVAAAVKRSDELTSLEDNE